MRAAKALAALIATLILGQGVRPSAQERDAPATGSTAVLSWAAFECSMYADMSGEPASEHERLFKLGYDAGKRFLEAARAGAISEAEIKEKVPIGFSWHAAGPTNRLAPSL